MVFSETQETRPADPLLRLVAATRYCNSLLRLILATPSRRRCPDPHVTAVTEHVSLTPTLLLRAYSNGVFPMGDDDTGAIRWYAPNPRGILPLDTFYVPNNLDRRVQRREFSVTTDQGFEDVIRACADRRRTWITEPIIRVYCELHEMGFAHSVECWKDDALAGGLYGVALGGAFFGESMFYRVSNASKVALVHLVRQMKAGGYVLLDTQYSNPHLEQFGVVEISRSDYEDRLAHAIALDPTWWPAEETTVARGTS